MGDQNVTETCGTRGQWRGAEYEDPHDGQAWLVAAGMRREKDHDDFYERIGRLSPGTIASYLPTDDDRVLLRRARARDHLRRWELAVVSVAVDVVAQAAKDGEARAALPSLHETDLAMLQDLLVAARLGEYEAVPSGPIQPTATSHYADKRSLARALVCGEAIVAICGAAFVPRRDPHTFQICVECADRYAQLTGASSGSP